MEKHNFVNIQTLNREELLHLLEMAKEFEAHPNDVEVLQRALRLLDRVESSMRSTRSLTRT